MFRFVRDISLRVKITLAFIPIVLGGTAISIFIGSGLITRAMLAEAERRVSTGIEAARSLYELRLDRVRVAVVRGGSSPALLNEIVSGDPARIAPVLADLRADNGLDFMGFVDTRGRLTTSSGETAGVAGHEPYEALVRSALSRETLSCTAVLDAATLAREGRALALRARLRVVPAPGEAAGGGGAVDSGLVMLSLTAVRVRGRIAGAAYGGVLLNRSEDFVHEVKQAVFGSEVFRGRQVGAVSIFLGPVRISTEELDAGTEVSPEVAEKVLGYGERWLGRAPVLRDWYIAAYEPLHDPTGRVVGMLGVGVREDRYLALRTRLMLTFIAVAAVGVLIVFGMTYLIARAMIKPLAAMATATRKIAAGDLYHTVPVTSGDEIGTLAESFNSMMDSLRVARDELEQWTRTLEDKVRERTAELVQMQVKMTEAEKMVSLGRMAAGVAHEINNPMGGILTFASLGLQDLPPEHPQRRNFEVIIKQTMRCRDIVRGLLEFSHQTESKPSPTDVNDVVDRTLMLVQQQASFQNIRVVRDSGASLPPVLVDPGHLQQVVLNLLVNAADAMEEKGDMTVATGLSPDGREVRIAIKDTGKGIPKDILPNIFEPFFTTKEVGKGTGLGLAIVHGIVTRAGGRVEVDTSPRGTTFTVSFPLGGPAPQDRASGLTVEAGLA